MYIVYVLKSKRFEHYYIGQTFNLNRRLQEHNFGNTYWTKRYRPWEVIYLEILKTKQEAIKREKYFKSHVGRNWLKKKLSPHSLMDKTKDS